MDFSIIIPAKNEENNLAQCLRSIAELDYPKDAFEVLVIDNGSTDNTVEIARSYGAEVHVKPEMTISGLRNFGSSIARGKTLSFIDADCTVLADWLKSASIWDEHPEVCCYGGPPTIPERATWVQKSWYIVRKKSQEIEDVDWLESMNMFVRKKAFVDVSGFDESLQTCEDYDLSLRLKEHGRIVADRRINAVHHGEASTVAHFYQKESWRGISNLAGLKRHGFHRLRPSAIGRRL
jgi:glycosyltransferase involved in cell wall biosynthesis